MATNQYISLDNQWNILPGARNDRTIATCGYPFKSDTWIIGYSPIGKKKEIHCVATNGCLLHKCMWTSIHLTAADPVATNLYHTMI